MITKKSQNSLTFVLTSKNRSLVAKRSFPAKSVLFKEQPLVSSQFTWNKFYQYKVNLRPQQALVFNLLFMAAFSRLVIIAWSHWRRQKRMCADLPRIQRSLCHILKRTVLPIKSYSVPVTSVALSTVAICVAIWRLINFTSLCVLVSRNQIQIIL